MRASQSGSGFVHAAFVLPNFLTVSAASLLLAKQVLKPLSPGASHAATVGHAMQQNVCGCKPLSVFSSSSFVATNATVSHGAGRKGPACGKGPAGAARSAPHGNHGDNLLITATVIA